MKNLNDILSKLNEIEEKRFMNEYKRKFVEIEVMIGYNQGYNRCLNDLEKLIKEHESELKGCESTVDIEGISEKLAENLQKLTEKMNICDTSGKSPDIVLRKGKQDVKTIL